MSKQGLYDSDPERIINFLMNDPVHAYTGVAGGFTIADIQVSIIQFNAEMFAASEGTGVLPMIEYQGSYRPVSMGVLFLRTSQFSGSTVGPDRVPEYTFHLRPEELPRVPNVQLFPISRVKDTFVGLAIKFLSQRIRGRVADAEVRSNPKWSRVQLEQHVGGDLANFFLPNVEVRTHGSGLRVFCSGAYFISSNPRFFGAPTSPVQNPLSPGIYSFGVDGSSLASVEWDYATFVIPDVTVCQLRF